MDVSSSRGLLGGHPEDEGISPSGEIVRTAEHAHRVELDLKRYELGISRTFDDTLDAFLRIPYFVKDQTASVLFEDGTSPADRDAAIRSGKYHHRTAIYEGFSDFELGVGWRKRDLLGEDSVFRFSLGVTLPFGEYEQNDPLRAGDLGLEHLHIQFGNGTFDPLVDFYLSVPLVEKLSFNLYGKGRFPLYENEAGYLGSVECTLIPRVTWQATDKLTVSAGAAANYYGYAEWNDRRDPNSGQFSTNAALSLGYKFNQHLSGSFSTLFPLYTKSFSGEDALDPAPTFSLSMAWTF